MIHLEFKDNLEQKVEISVIPDIFTGEDNYEKYATQGPDVVSHEFYEWRIFS